MTTASPRRDCRRRCKGCDPCWICRWSYPTAVVITANPSAPSGGGLWPGNCRQKAVGTFAVADPFTGPWDNGTTIHWPIGTAKTDGIGPAKDTRCGAHWRFKSSEFVVGDFFGLPLYKTAVFRCGGVEGQYDLEWVNNLYISYGVGSRTENSIVAANSKSTRVTVSIQETLAGWHDTDPSISSTGTVSSWTVQRIEQFIVDLGKPCPKTGSFTMTHQSTTVTDLSSSDEWFGSDVTPPTYATHTGNNYQVSIDL